MELGRFELEKKKNQQTCSRSILCEEQNNREQPQKTWTRGITSIFMEQESQRKRTGSEAKKKKDVQRNKDLS